MSLRHDQEGGSGTGWGGIGMFPGSDITIHRSPGGPPMYISYDIPGGVRNGGGLSGDQDYLNLMSKP